VETYTPLENEWNLKPTKFSEVSPMSRLAQ